MYPPLAEKEWKHFNEDIRLYILAVEEIFQSEDLKMLHIQGEIIKKWGNEMKD